MRKVLIAASTLMVCFNAYADDIAEAENDGCVVVAISDSQNGPTTYLECNGVPTDVNDRQNNPQDKDSQDDKNPCESRKHEVEAAVKSDIAKSYRELVVDCDFALNEQSVKLCPTEGVGPGADRGKPSSCEVSLFGGRRVLPGACLSNGFDFTGNEATYTPGKDPGKLLKELSCKAEVTCRYNCIPGNGCGGVL